MLPPNHPHSDLFSPDPYKPIMSQYLGGQTTSSTHTNPKKKKLAKRMLKEPRPGGGVAGEPDGIVKSERDGVTTTRSIRKNSNCSMIAKKVNVFAELASLSSIGLRIVPNLYVCFDDCNNSDASEIIIY